MAGWLRDAYDALSMLAHLITKDTRIKYLVSAPPIFNFSLSWFP
jgi:hypothetical protein